MIRHICYRLLLMIPTLLVISVITFTIIQAPPGDFAESRIANMRAMGEMVDQEQLESLRKQYGLDKPMHIRYLSWIWRIVRHGDLGNSMTYSRTVGSLILERLPATLQVSVFALIVVWSLGIPIGLYSATHKNSIGDYVFTLIGYIGVCTPGFLLAILVMYGQFLRTGQTRFGLMSEEFMGAPFSFAKLLDIAAHMWIPALLVGLAGIAGVIRTMRANLLDEVDKPYVTVARAKGMDERRILFKYPFRIALNPVMSNIGFILPYLISGQVLVAYVMSLPTLAPLMLEALLNQDMYLAAGIIMLQSLLAVFGVLISDILLAWVDPRVRAI